MGAKFRIGFECYVKKIKRILIHVYAEFDRSFPFFHRFDSMDSTGSNRQQSLVSIFADGNFIDPNVAATEQEVGV